MSNNAPECSIMVARLLEWPSRLVAAAEENRLIAN
jgi:hypothetical protein